MKNTACALLLGVCLVLRLPAADDSYVPDTADATSADGAIQLPSAEVTERQDSAEYVDQEQMERENSFDLWQALRNVPGLVRDTGGGMGGMRNDSTFTVRGMNEVLVPVFIDGVPMAEPYRGDNDYARFLTGDLADVEIQKGYSSMLLGPDTLGGAVIMRTALPKKPFEFTLRGGLGLDNALRAADTANMVSVGSKQDSFYAKSVFQYRYVDHWNLSNNFVPDERNPQGPGRRIFSDSNDLKLTLLAGWTPSDYFSLDASYVYQDADKGTSPPEVFGYINSYAAWLKWRRQFAALSGSFRQQNYRLGASFYFDKYDNTFSQDNTAAQIAAKEYADPSTYDDFGFGAALEGGFTVNSWSEARAALRFRQQGHKDLWHDTGTTTKDIIENTWSLGAEYEIAPLPPLRLVAGFGFDLLQPFKFYHVNSLEETRPLYMFSWQAGVFYKLSGTHTVYFTHAKKNHIPTMSARYSEGSGDFIPNPLLKNETAYHFELGYKGAFAFAPHRQFRPAFSVSAALYYARLADMVGERDTWVNGILKKKRVNINSTGLYGFEAGLEAVINDWLNLGGNYNYALYKVLEADENLTGIGNYPRSTMNFYMEFHPFTVFSPRLLRSFSLVPSLEYEGPRYRSKGNVNLNAAEIMPRFALLHFRASFEISANFSAAFGVTNLLDEHYAFNDSALPSAGRAFFISVKAEIK